MTAGWAVHRLSEICTLEKNQHDGRSLPYVGMEYLTRRDLREYNQIEDTIDRSIFVDAVIRRRAESGNLVDLSTLPPWITASAKRYLNSIIDPCVEGRLPTIAEVAAVLTQLRVAIRDWQWLDGH